MILGAGKVVLSQRAFGQKVLWLIEEVYLRLQRPDLFTPESVRHRQSQTAG